MVDITGTIDREKTLLILEWCQNKFGKSKFSEEFPTLFVYKTRGISCDGDEDGRYGHYVDGKISIFLGSHKTVVELCGTVIHEYKHYLIGDDEYQREYKNLKKRGVGEKDIMRQHPHEKIAKKFEKSWKYICFYQLKDELYKR